MTVATQRHTQMQTASIRHNPVMMDAEKNVQDCASLNVSIGAVFQVL